MYVHVINIPEFTLLTSTRNDRNGGFPEGEGGEGVKILENNVITRWLGLYNFTYLEIQDRGNWLLLVR